MHSGVYDILFITPDFEKICDGQSDSVKCCSQKHPNSWKNDEAVSLGNKPDIDSSFMHVLVVIQSSAYSIR